MTRRSRFVSGLQLFALLATILLGSFTASATDWADLIGYTVLSVSKVDGEFEGADFDKNVALSNGMVFQFRSYHYTYSFMPEAVVFVKPYPKELADQLVAKGLPPGLAAWYKLMIKDYIYNVVRLR